MATGSSPHEELYQEDFTLDRRQADFLRARSSRIWISST